MKEPVIKKINNEKNIKNMTLEQLIDFFNFTTDEIETLKDICLIAQVNSDVESMKI